VSRGESPRKIEEEIRQAKAEALGRVGERLESALAELAEPDRGLDRLAAGAWPDAARAARLARETAARNRLRDEAVRLSQQLEIQRKAIGLVRHDLVEERYPVPPRLATRWSIPQASRARRGSVRDVR